MREKVRDEREKEYRNNKMKEEVRIRSLYKPPESKQQYDPLNPY